MGEAIALYRERTRFTTIEEEESFPLQQLSTSLYSTMAATVGSTLSLTFLSNICLYL